MSDKEDNKNLEEEIDIPKINTDPIPKEEINEPIEEQPIIISPEENTEKENEKNEPKLIANENPLPVDENTEKKLEYSELLRNSILSSPDTSYMSPPTPSTPTTPKPGPIHLSSSETKEVLADSKKLPTKQKVFSQIREIEEKRVPRHAACLKLYTERWNAMKSHLDKGYSEVKNLTEYASKFVDAHKKLVSAHEYLEKAIVPSLGSSETDTNKETSLQPFMKALNNLHELSIEKLNSFIKEMGSTVVDNKLNPMKEQYKIEVDKISDEVKDAIKKFEKMGKNCSNSFEKLNDALTKTIKSKEEGKAIRIDFWTAQASYVAAINTEANTRQYLETHLSQAFETIKVIEKTRIESTQKAMISLIQTTQNVYFFNINSYIKN